MLPLLVFFFFGSPFQCEDAVQIMFGFGFTKDASSSITAKYGEPDEDGPTSSIMKRLQNKELDSDALFNVDELTLIPLAITNKGKLAVTFFVNKKLLTVSVPSASCCMQRRQKNCRRMQERVNNV